MHGVAIDNNRLQYPVVKMGYWDKPEQTPQFVQLDCLSVRL